MAGSRQSIGGIGALEEGWHLNVGLESVEAQQTTACARGSAKEKPVSRSFSSRFFLSAICASSVIKLFFLISVQIHYTI
jgi:hypothetical protein